MRRVLGSLRFREWKQASVAQREMAAIHCEGCMMRETVWEGANLRSAHFEGAELDDAYLHGARLQGAHFAGATMPYAHLEAARLQDAQFGGAVLDESVVGRMRAMHPAFARQMPPGDLRFAFFDADTHLEGIKLGDARRGAASLANVRWGGVNVTVVDWSLVQVLGDERAARTRIDEFGKPKTYAERLTGYLGAVRAYRQLAAVLREQGASEDADRFAYRSQVVQRVVLRLQRKVVRWLFSGFLDALAGHGFKPGRSLVAYLAAILGFGAAYYALGQATGPHLSPLGAFVFSMTSFHGRGFFPGGIGLDDPLTVLAAFEAFVGLVIEVSFIATFTQRFFAR
jgi:hypothetical protein